MKTYVFEVQPMGAPRMSRQDRFKPSTKVQRFKIFGQYIRTKSKTCGFIMPYSNISMRFYMSIPTALDKKKLTKAEREALIGQPHTAKPDIDNLFKGFTDSYFYHKKNTQSEVEGNDCKIHDVRLSKFWCRKGEERIEIDIL